MTTNKSLVDVNIFEDVIRKRKDWEEGRIISHRDAGNAEKRFCC